MTGRRQLHVVQLLRDQPLLRQILAVVVTVFLGAVTAIVIVGSLTVLKIDGQALQRQLLFVEQGTQARFAQVPTEQESVTIWDDALLRLRSNDQSWMDENVGVWMNSYFGHDRVYVLNPEDAPIYAMESGESASASLYAQDRVHIEPLVKALRSSIAAAVAGGNAPADGDGQEAGGSLGAKDYVWLPTGLAIASGPLNLTTIVASVLSLASV